jgi:hypothetical protein
MTGLVIPVAARYEAIALRNLKRLRRLYRVELPVEIWEVEKEITVERRREFSQLGGVTYRNVKDHSSEPGHWKGVQVKAFAARYTSFDEFLLCDADVTFLRNPLRVFQDKRYMSTGAFFFRDLSAWKFKDLGPSETNKFSSRSFFSSRQSWLLGLLPKKVEMFPSEWSYIYETDYPSRPVHEAYMEAGAIYVDRSRHGDTLETAYRLNENHEETYRYVLGDKETWWIACCICGKPFAMNTRYPSMIRKLTQFYGILPFYVQK